MTTGLERVRAALRGELPDRTPIAPILHAMGARLIGVPIGRYASDAGLMARAILAAYERFGYDGAQLSLGVAAEAEALGAPTAQPEDGLPVVTRPLLEEPADLARLALPDRPRRATGALCRGGQTGGRETVETSLVVATFGGRSCGAAAGRGQFWWTSWSARRGAPNLTFTTGWALPMGGCWWRRGPCVAIGEATSSPDASPRLFRERICLHALIEAPCAPAPRPPSCTSAGGRCPSWGTWPPRAAT